MQKIVLFIEPSDDAWRTPLKIGNLFMNRFAVDEDAAFEVMKIFELEKTSFEMSKLSQSTFKNFKKERIHKGKDLNIKTDRLNSFTIVNRNENS